MQKKGIAQRAQALRRWVSWSAARHLPGARVLACSWNRAFSCILLLCRALHFGNRCSSVCDRGQLVLYVYILELAPA